MCRRIPSVAPPKGIPSVAPPKGKATKAWVQCVKALTNLLGQNEHLTLEGTYQPDPLYDQLTMMAQCLPILLLRLPKPFSQAAHTKLICRRCDLFLAGSWRLLTTEAARELQERPAPPTNDDQHPPPVPTHGTTIQHCIVAPQYRM